MKTRHHDVYTDEIDPTGYYRRKAERNNEFVDKALIPFFKAGALICLSLMAVGAVLS